MKSSPKVSVKWNDELNFTFLDLYEQHECLWNVDVKTYRDKSANRLAYSSILDSMDIDGFMVTDVKNKIKSMRTTYAQELAKVKLDRDYRPRLAWYSRADRFLRNVMTTRSSNGRVTKASSDMEERDYGEKPGTPGNDTINDTMPSMHQLPKLKRKYTSVQSINDSTNDEIMMVPSKVKCTSGPSVAASASAATAASKDSSKEDEFDFFSKFISSQLRMLPLEKALRCEQEIFQLLAKERISFISCLE